MSRRIRIVYCIDNMGVGGTELNALRTAERLDRSRFELTVVALRSDGPLRSRYSDAEIPVRAWPIRALYHPYTAGEAARLARFFANTRTDIVHSHDPYNNVFATVAARLAGVKVIVASRRWLEPPNRARSLTVLNALAYRAAHRVIANSPSMARSLQRREKLSPRRITVIPNFVDEDAFTPLDVEGVRRLRAEFALTPEDLVVGAVARLSKPKDQATLLQAASVLAKEWPRLHLVLVGDGPEREALERLSTSLGIASIVHFTGTRPPRPNLQHAFDVSVLPTRKEGFPNVLLEAMAAARPVIASNVGGVPDAVVDGVTGVLVPPGDPRHLRDAIAALLRDAARRREMGAAGARLARERYHAGFVVPMLADHYETWARDA